MIFLWFFIFPIFFFTVLHVSNKEALTTICSIHNQRDCAFYCNSCKTSACSLCVLLEHSEHRVVKLLEALDQSRDILRSRLDMLTHHLSNLRHRLDQFSQKKVDGGTGREGKDLLEKAERLSNLSATVLELAQSQKILTLYEDLSSRIKSVIDIEIHQLRMALDSSVTPGSEQPSPEQNMKTEHEQLKRTHTGNALYKPEVIWRMEKLRTDSSDLFNPCDVTWYENRLIIVDYDTASNSKLRVFDVAARKELGILGTSDVKPLGVCVTRDGNIAVTDSKEKKVKILSSEGLLIDSWGKGHFGWPYGITVDSRGHFIVSDAFSDTVGIYSSDGKLKVSVGNKNITLRNPYHVTVDKNDNVVVCDSGNNCVKVFDISSGRLMASMRRTISSTGGPRKSTKLRSPKGVCTDHRAGHILVADEFSRVCMFDTQFEYVRNLLTEQDHIKFPEALDINKYGQLAVTEWSPSNMCALTVFSIYA